MATNRGYHCAKDEEIFNGKLQFFCRVLFTDTESFVYEFETENVYDSFSRNKKTFDFSNYSAKSKYNDYLNGLVIGNMKE